MSGSTSLQINLAPWQAATLENDCNHFALLGGVAIGKSFTGAQFAIRMAIQYPHLTGIVAANTYDQLSQATLRELFYWLDQYNIPYVVDCMPPPEWGQTKKQFKKYMNILSLYLEPNIVTIFTRILSAGDPLRGIEFSWYWLDETRDTPQMSHDIILSRMRESDIMKGLITTTPNGEDWTYQRFVLGADGSKTYGSMHVPTQKSVDYGIITQEYYNVMARSYSPMMAEQELHAKHVNVLGGRAYYAAGDWNRRTVAPWGDEFPNPDRPLIVGEDFNFQPAPCIWVVGQQGPGEWSEHIHWFGEIAEVQASTVDMTNILMARYPDFFYRCFGDASGNRGTTSNAGETDYNQQAQTFGEAGAFFSIDSDQANPHVKKRVENLNSLFKNALGETSMTYNPQTCPHLDTDVRMVGWKVNQISQKGRLDTGGDVNRTHASDGVGYAAMKLRPPGRRATLVEGISSPHTKEIGRAF